MDPNSHIVSFNLRDHRPAAPQAKRIKKLSERPAALMK
jgi:hypothetical protein